MFDDETDEDREYEEKVGLTEEDLQVHYRAAFMTLVPAWDQRHLNESAGKPVDREHFHQQMELAYRRLVEARQVMEMVDLS